jgi:nucleoside-diphosphate kinase
LDTRKSEMTLVIIKPDAVARRLVGEIIRRIETKGLAIRAVKMVKVSREVAEGLYAPHKGKDFYEPLVRFMTGAPSVLMVVEGIEAISVVRRLMGPTFGSDAEPGTIRGDLGMSRRFNLVHSPDCLESAEREMELFFGPDEILDTPQPDRPWVYDLTGPEPV